MAHDYNSNSSSLGKPVEHPAKAIMAKRWEERRAEARARRLAELRLGDSGLITLKHLADAAAMSGGTSLADLSAATPVPDAVSGIPELAPADSNTVAAPTTAPQELSATAPSWLRDSRKALLIVAVVSNGLLFALLYFGGFLS